MRINKNKTNCCGCTACENICPHNAIKMKPDTLGFLYPEVDNTLCVDCGLCEKVCAFHKQYDRKLNLPFPMAYAVRHKEVNEIESSQSGAAFIALSDWILDQGGIVYGVGYKDHFRVVHKKALTKKERNEFKGSKYVQSDVNTVFSQIKEELRNGRVVLFSGTPCQTAGLSSYIGAKLRTNLYLVDIICHGVPGPFIWQDYIKYLEEKEGLPLTFVNFRDKRLGGWASSIESFQFADGHTHTYSYKFYTNITLRYSCGICPYTNLQRPSDVTVGDFWGVEHTNAFSFAKDSKGCSLVLVNTEKGEYWFSGIKEHISYISVRLEDCLQPNLQHPTLLHSKRKDFEQDYKKNGFYRTMKKYGYIGGLYEIKLIIRKLIPHSIKSKLKIIIKAIFPQLFKDKRFDYNCFESAKSTSEKCL